MNFFESEQNDDKCFEALMSVLAADGNQAACVEQWRERIDLDGLSKPAESTTDWLRFVDTLLKSLHLPGWDPRQLVIQLALDLPRSNLVSLAAARYLNKHPSDFVWYEWLNRPDDTPAHQPDVEYLGHCNYVSGILPLDSERFMTWGSDPRLHVWCSRTGKPLLDFGWEETDQTRVHQVIRIDASALVAHAQDKSEVRVWDLNSGATLAELVLEKNYATDLALIDQDRILIGTRDGRLLVWSWRASPVATVEWTGHSGRVVGCEMLSNGRALSWSTDSILCLWDPTLNVLIERLNGHDSPIRRGTLLQSGEILSIAQSGEIFLWDGTRGSLLGIFDVPIEQKNVGRVIGALEFGSDQIVTWGDCVALWDRSERFLSTILPFPDGIEMAHHGLLIDDRLLITTHFLGTMVATDLRQEFPTRTLNAQNVFTPTEVFRNNSEMLALGHDGYVVAWNPASGETRTTAVRADHGVTWLKVLPDDRLATLADSGVVRVWPEASLWSVPEGTGHTPLPVQVHQASVLSEKHTVVLSGDNRLLLYTMQSDHNFRISENTLCDSAAGFLVFDQNKILTWGHGPDLHLYDGTTGERIALLCGMHGDIQSVIGLSECEAVSVDAEGNILLWDLRSDDRPVAFEIQNTAPRELRKIPGGGLLGVGKDGVFLWPSSGGLPTAFANGLRGNAPSAIALSSDYALCWDRVAWGGRDMAGVWSISSGELIRSFEWNRPVGYGSALVVNDYTFLVYTPEWIEVRSMTTFESLAIVEGIDSPIENLTTCEPGFGVHFATRHADLSVRLWEIADNQINLHHSLRGPMDWTNLQGVVSDTTWMVRQQLPNHPIDLTATRNASACATWTDGILKFRRRRES
jgi:WD40 repeat protein